MNYELQITSKVAIGTKFQNPKSKNQASGNRKIIADAFDGNDLDIWIGFEQISDFCDVYIEVS